MKTYRIREFAALARVTPKALRHYDRIGLLKPDRNRARYRVYTDDHLRRLQQIGALRMVGLPLARIRQVLDEGIVPLREALHAQHAALVERRDHLDAALRAIERAQQEADGANEAARPLSALIRALTTPRVDVLRKYFSNEAWLKWRSRYPSWPSDAWIDLYREAQASLTEGADTPHAQALARRCIALAETDTLGDRAIRTALRRAMTGGTELKVLLQAAMPDVDVARVGRFLATAAWDKWQAPDGRTYDTPTVRPRASEAWTALLHDFSCALDDTQLSARVQLLMTRRAALMADDSGGDPSIQAAMERAEARWQNWPAGMRRWIASLHGMQVNTWERVMTLIHTSH